MIGDLMKAGGPAFPSTNDLGEGTTSSFMGMTLRDYFAGQAIIGIMSNDTISTDFEARGQKNGTFYTWELAIGAYEIADKMLKARTGI
jgi:hypothetical protein